MENWKSRFFWGTSGMVAVAYLPPSQNSMFDIFSETQFSFPCKIIENCGFHLADKNNNTIIVAHSYNSSTGTRKLYIVTYMVLWQTQRIHSMGDDSCFQLPKWWPILKLTVTIIVSILSSRILRFPYKYGCGIVVVYCLYWIPYRLQFVMYNSSILLSFWADWWCEFVTQFPFKS